MIIESKTKVCQNCHGSFVIEPDDFAFYEKIGVPAPTWCPDCRFQRRLTWRNERSFYKRPCDLCKKNIIAMYPADAPFPVYCQSCWYSDNWDAGEFGRDYDFSKPFLLQFKELQNVVPRIALQQNNCVNSEYTNQVGNCKNCYLISSSSESEDCYFSYRLHACKGIFDSYALLKCESCYELAIGRESSRLFFTQGGANSLDLYFCEEPRSSQSCFMSANLRQKSHVFRGTQLEKKEYERRIKEINFGSYATIEAFRKEFKEMCAQALHAPGTFKNITRSTGNAIANASNCRACFHGSDLENCAYMVFVNDAKDSMDVNNGCCVMELFYEVCTAGLKSANVKFSVDAWPEIFNLQYCDSCRDGSHDLFGSISMRKKEYCVLNKRYTKEEYEVLVPKIIKHMNDMPYTDKKGRVYRYGEFFPTELSPFPYPDTSAQDFFPLDAERADALGFVWKSAEVREYDIALPAKDIPDDIKDISDDILKQTIGCLHEGKCGDRCTTAFKIVPEELAFYRRMVLPLPRLCPNCRHYERLKQRNPLKLWHRKCMKPGCQNEFETSYSPDRKEIIYCERCYNAEVA